MSVGLLGNRKSGEALDTVDAQDGSRKRRPKGVRNKPKIEYPDKGEEIINPFHLINFKLSIYALKLSLNDGCS